ncbi:hypothetical protein ACL02S_11765 [Nocardia sp. 004]|uniref:hypothetical protein n=1 Tax=Nocardia sp. 004 TaxID=3385978 RepID=UPI0039A31868
MGVTVGISAEQAVVRGVMLLFEARQGAGPIVLREIEQPVGNSIAASVAATLDALVSAAGPRAKIDDVAVTYRTVAERRAIVSQVSGQSPSLVSIRTALLALLDDLPGPAKYGTVLVLEVSATHTSYFVTGPQRDALLASDSWAFGVVDSDTAAQVVSRVRPTLDAAGLAPAAVVLCGSAAGNPEIVSALRLGLDVPVIGGPDFVYAAAYGAALVAATRAGNTPVAPIPAEPRRTGRVLVATAAVAAVLGGAVLTIMQLRTEHSEPKSPTAASAAASPWSAATTEPHPETRPHQVNEPVPAPPAPPAEPIPPPAEPYPSEEEQEEGIPHEPVPPQAAPAAPVAPAAPAAAPPANNIGTTNHIFLFPGEPPPPPWNAAPTAVHDWWDNHTRLTERWIHGR